MGNLGSETGEDSRVKSSDPGIDEVGGCHPLGLPRQVGCSCTKG